MLQNNGFESNWVIDSVMAPGGRNGKMCALQRASGTMAAGDLPATMRDIWEYFVIH